MLRCAYLVQLFFSFYTKIPLSMNSHMNAHFSYILTVKNFRVGRIFIELEVSRKSSDLLIIEFNSQM